MSKQPAPHIEEAVDVFRLLADRTRLSIMLLLAESEMSVGDIASTLGRPLPAISQHLAKLRAAGFVQVRREGTCAFYSQPDVHLAELITQAMHHVEHRLYAEPPHHHGDGGAHHDGHELPRQQSCTLPQAGATEPSTAAPTGEVAPAAV